MQGLTDILGTCRYGTMLRAHASGRTAFRFFEIQRPTFLLGSSSVLSFGLVLSFLPELGDRVVSRGFPRVHLEGWHFQHCYLVFLYPFGFELFFLFEMDPLHSFALRALHFPLLHSDF